MWTKNKGVYNCNITSDNNSNDVNNTKNFSHNNSCYKICDDHVNNNNSNNKANDCDKFE